LQIEFFIDLFVPVFSDSTGEVSEWLKEHAWKVCIRETVSRVRIPLSPQIIEIVPAQAGFCFFRSNPKRLACGLRKKKEKQRAKRVHDCDDLSPSPNGITFRNPSLSANH
jgi:hypothetical protein